MPDKPTTSYRMPAEWQSHSAVWLAWPYDKISFGSLNFPKGQEDPELLSRVEQKVVEIIKALHESESVELLVLDKTMESKTRQMLEKDGVNLAKITFHITDYADVW